MSSIALNPLRHPEERPPQALRFTFARHRSWLAVVSCLVCSLSWAQDDEIDVLTRIPFEELVKNEVQTSSRLARQVSDALSAVTIVTADEIKAYGFRTLAEVINSMRGQYTTYDRLYQYVGGRGFGVPGDFAGRALMLIDGYPTPDNIYNQNYIDNGALIDLEAVERIEYVPGSGSVIYGNNALLSLINIVTKKGAALGRAQLSGETASYGGRKLSLQYGDRLENGTDVLFSASRQRSRGQDIYMPGFDTPEQNNGVAVGQDGESSARWMGKISGESWSATAAWVSRTKGRPTATDGWLLYDFNADQRSTDENGYISLQHSRQLAPHLLASTHLYLGSYLFDGKGFQKGVFVRDLERGLWWGVDQKFSWKNWSGHTPVLGIELRSDRQSSRIELIEDKKASKATLGLYAQDNYQFTERWTLNAGLRLDVVDEQGHTLSPRAGLIFQASPRWVFKSSAGVSHRQPTFFERYSEATFKEANLGLQPERVSSLDILAQFDWSATTKLTATAYRYALLERIAFDASPSVQSYLNVGPSQSRGLEFELDHRGTNGDLLKASAAIQRAADSAGAALVNAPHVVFKLHGSQLLSGLPVRLGVEYLYLGPRLTQTQRRLAGFPQANLTLTSSRKWNGLAWGLGVKNLTDRVIDVVSPITWELPRGGVQDTLRMDRRNYWLRVSYDLGW
jgi:outer membrane receptor protein involved in Fe transport